MLFVVIYHAKLEKIPEIVKMVAEKGITGTLRVYGGAAEETEGAKIYMARADLKETYYRTANDEGLRS